MSPVGVHPSLEPRDCVLLRANGREAWGEGARAGSVPGHFLGAEGERGLAKTREERWHARALETQE